MAAAEPGGTFSSLAPHQLLTAHNFVRSDNARLAVSWTLTVLEKTSNIVCLHKSKPVYVHLHLNCFLFPKNSKLLSYMMLVGLPEEGKLRTGRENPRDGHDSRPGLAKDEGEQTKLLFPLCSCHLHPQLN